MKKLITSILAVSMLGAMSVSAFATTPSTLESGTTGDKTHDVQVKYDDSTNTTIYSVEIAWGDMQFNYSAGTWDPDNHVYTGTSGFTAAATGGDKVTITNHSNKAVTATVAYTAESSYNAITGSVNPADATTIASATTTIGDPDNAPKKEFTVSLGGTPAAQIATYTKVGTLNITLA